MGKFDLKQNLAPQIPKYPLNAAKAPLNSDIAKKDRNTLPGH